MRMAELGQQVAHLGAVLGCHRANQDTAVGLCDRVQTLDPAQVDQQVGVGKSQAEQRHQALAPGERLGIFVAREQAERLVEALGGHIVEGGRFHARPPSWC